jgi:hypothetical protein
MIISISGKIGSGKDTIAEIIKEKMPEAGWEVKKFAGKLKEVATLLTSIPVDKFEDQSFKQTTLPSEWNDSNGDPMTVRDLLQRLGTEAMRHGLHNNVWVNALFSDYKPMYNVKSPMTADTAPNWIITDTRFPNEIDACVNRGAITILVQRDSGNHVGTTHASETALDDYNQWDYIVDNTGSVENLRRKVHEILRENSLIN